MAGVGCLPAQAVVVLSIALGLYYVSGAEVQFIYGNFKTNFEAFGSAVAWHRFVTERRHRSALTKAVPGPPHSKEAHLCE